MANNYTIDYNDKRFQEVKNQEAAAIKQTQGTYDKMINASDSYYQQQIDASKEWANKQSELQQAQTDHTIAKIEQQKGQAKQDYVKEQKGAYTDYQKATNQYGVNAEKEATQGLQDSGYSESTRTSMYNTYQNRYMSAREVYNRAVLNYDNSIKDAQLANSSALATIAYEALQKQLELSLQGFQYKNNLLLQKVDAVNAEKDRYYNRYQNVLQQINTENKLAEEVRQYNESMALQKQKLQEEIRQYNETLAFNKQKQAQEQARWEKEYALAKSKASSSGGSSGGSKSKSSGSTKLTNGGSSSSTKLSNGSSSTKKTSSSSNLSSGGVKLYNAISTMARGSKANLNSAAVSSVNAEILNRAYKKNQINANDVKIISRKLGYE